MSLFGRVAKTLGFNTEKKSIGHSVGQITGNPLMELLFSGTKLNPAAAMNFYQQVASVSTAVDCIADEIQGISPVLENNKTGKIVADHDVIKLLTNPNGAESGNMFLSSLSRHYLLTHDAYIYAAGSVNRPPAELWAVKPQNVSVSKSMDGYAHSFIVSNGKGSGNYTRKQDRRMGWRYYDGSLEELYRISSFSSSSDNVRPDSPLNSAALEARQQILGRYHNLRILENGGRLSLVAIFKDTMDQEQHDMRRHKINEQMAGADNAGKIGVISADDLEIKEFGNTNKDMDFAELDKTAREAIYLRYKVPLPLVSMDASTFNNLEQAVYHLYDRAVIPTYSYLMTGVTRMLLPRYGMDPSEWTITYNPEDIPALQSRRVDELKKRKDIGIETINELRSFLPGRGPVEGGDDIMQPATMVPIASDLNTDDANYTEQELRSAVE